jgi:hypothetical protein
MPTLAAFYDASFDGTSFWEQDGSGDGWRPGRPHTRAGSTVHMGSTNTNVRLDMGAGASEFDVIAGCDAAEYSALMGKAGTTGTLVWSRGSESVYCVEVVDSPGEAGSTGLYKITLRMVKL